MGYNFTSVKALNGHYNNVCGCYKVIIDTDACLVVVENNDNEDEFYAFSNTYGENVIAAINDIYNDKQCTIEQAVSKWLVEYFKSE